MLSLIYGHIHGEQILSTSPFHRDTSRSGRWNVQLLLSLDVDRGRNFCKLCSKHSYVFP